MSLPPATPGATRRETLLVMLMLVGVTIVTYGNTFAVPFLFDDYLSIPDNVTIRHFATAWLPPSGDGITVSGRPLLNLTLALNHAISGDAVWSYHLGNLLIHVLAGCVLFDVVRRTLRQPRLAARFGAEAMTIAAVAAQLWLLHPLQTESVTYLIQRAESLAGLMYLLTLWAFVRATTPGAARGWFVATGVFCLLGMAAKETLVTAPVMILFYDRVFVAESWREVWFRRWRLYLALAATWLLLAGLIINTGSRGGSVGFGGAITAGTYALTQIGAIVHYLRLAFWPYPLAFDYGTVVASGWGEVAWSAVILFPLLGATLWALARNRPAGHLGAFFFALLAPTSSFVPVQTQTMSEHRMYLALAALAVLVATLLYRTWGRRGLFAGCFLALGLGGLTIARNQDYRTEVGIWEDTANKRPKNARAYTILGTIYQKENRYDEALDVLQYAIKLEPKNAEAWNNLGSVRIARGEWDQAIEAFRHSLTLKPDVAFVHSNLGMVLNRSGRPEEALPELETALRLDPSIDTTRRYLAALLVQRKRPADAAAHFAIYLKNQPDDGAVHATYAGVLMTLGRGPEAIAEFEIAMRLNPQDAVLHNTFGLALARAGRVAEALPHFQEAVRLKPDYADARRNAEHAAQSPGRP